MLQSDKKYIQNLAKGLGITDESKLVSIVPPGELVAYLKTARISDYMGKKPWINLHTHSLASDGRLSPEEWLENALKWKQENNLETFVIALTDHDSIDGLIPVLKQLIKNPKKYEGLKIVLGCELSVAYQNEDTLHPVDFEILHYAVNPFKKGYAEALKKQSNRRIQQYPLIIEEIKQRYPFLNISMEDFKKSEFFGENIKKGLGCNWLYAIKNYVLSKAPQNFNVGEFYDYLMTFGHKENQKGMWAFVPEVLKEMGTGEDALFSIAHPYRLHFDQRIKNEFYQQHHFNDFVRYFLEYLSVNGVSGAELYYGNLNPNMQEAFEKMAKGQPLTTETEHWMELIGNLGKMNFPLTTGGNDNHDSYLGIAKDRYTHKNWNDLLTYWHQIQPLIQQGYKVLDKEVTMGMPGPCMPAENDQTDIGIGTPYGKGADRVWDFFDKTVHKILLGPSGRTSKETKHSPYVSDEHPNPFFIPVEYLLEKGLISKETLQSFYALPKTPEKIDFVQVEEAFNKILDEAYNKGGKKLSKQAFIDGLATEFAKKNTHPYIADLQVQIPRQYIEQNPELFLPDFTLGTPPDNLSPLARNWGFPVFNPKYLFTKEGKLGKGGLLWQQVIKNVIRGARGGLRIDHFIGFVNPYVISKDPNIPNGRLYSSYDHPILKQFALKNPKDFNRIIDKIINPVLKSEGLDLMDLYPEDIGARPEQMDEVMKHFGLGRLLVTQFKEPDNPNHMYQLNIAKKDDVAALDTHDTPSIQMFFDSLDDAGRYAHAKNLASHLRFNYTDDLKSTEQLTRMQWGELLASPAKRVQAFFTSWTGQIGRYNQPGNPVKWQLRCSPEFEELYFRNFEKGRAYNPLDAISLAIYARGDKFYEQHKDLVAQLRNAEENLKQRIHSWICNEKTETKTIPISLLQRKKLQR